MALPGPSDAPRCERRVPEITPSAPHAYLNILAVEPSMQGRNLGARALDGVVRFAGSRGLGVHLETANPRNHTFYARAGFVAGDELTLGAGGPTLRAMYRPVSR